jgi:hypothetical protein
MVDLVLITSNNMNQISFSREEGVCTIRESDIFLFVPVFLTPIQITTFVSGGAPTQYKCPLTGRVGAFSHPPGTNVSHLYQVVAPIGTNVRPAHLYRSESVQM